jgi:hypothetical protein
MRAGLGEYLCERCVLDATDLRVGSKHHEYQWRRGLPQCNPMHFRNSRRDLVRTPLRAEHR